MTNGNQEENKQTGWDRQRLRSRIRALLVVVLVGTVCAAVFIPAKHVNSDVFGQFMPLAVAAVMFFFKNTGDKSPEE